MEPIANIPHKSARRDLLFTAERLESSGITSLSISGDELTREGRVTKLLDKWYENI